MNEKKLYKMKERKRYQQHTVRSNTENHKNGRRSSTFAKYEESARKNHYAQLSLSQRECSDSVFQRYYESAWRSYNKHLPFCRRDFVLEKHCESVRM
jgi:hypothetical protein